MKYITTLCFIFLGLILNSFGQENCIIASDDRSLTEKLFKGDEHWTVFTCKILMQIKGKDSISKPVNQTSAPINKKPGNHGGDVIIKEINEDNNHYVPSPPKLAKAEIINVYFGSVDTTTVILKTGGYYVVNLLVGKSYLIYSYGTGKNFKNSNIDVSIGSKQVNDFPDSTNEVRLLKQFSDIFKHKKSGFFTFKDSNDIILSEGKYKKGKAVGIWKHYYDNGIIKAEYDLENEIIIDYSINGIINTKRCITKNFQTFENYSASGQLRYKQVTTKTDTGYVKLDYGYWSNGNIRNIMTTVNGEDSKMHWVEYYENGKIKKEGRVYCGRKVGVWKNYNENGILETEFDYKNGKDRVIYTDDSK